MPPAPGTSTLRVGLLTRFMGVLGVICGALIVLPILSPLPIVQTFWLGAMALLLCGSLAQRAAARVDDRRGGPAADGAEVREARRNQAGQRRRGGAPEPEPEPDPEREQVATEGRQQVASKKKKRKRRA